MDERTSLDHYAIRALGETFASALSRHDFDRFGTLWTPDASWELGEPLKASFTGRDEIVRGAEHLMARWHFFVQMPHAFDVVLEGDAARACWTVHTLFSDHDGFGGRTSVALYFDTLRRTEAGWRYARRRLQTVYTDTRPLPGKVFPLQDAERQWLTGGEAH